MLIDTVGFLRRLPHHLIEAFKSTLEQAATADVILNVCDASNPSAPEHMEVTRGLLAELGCAGRPVIPVLNKCDLVPDIALLPMIGKAVRISAKTGEGLALLLETVERNLPDYRRVTLLLPFSAAGLADRVRESGAVERVEYTPRGFRMTARVPGAVADAMSEYVVDPAPPQ